MAEFFADQTAAILRINLFENAPKERHPTHSNGTVKIKERVILEPGIYRSTLWKNEAYLSFTLEDKLEGQSQGQAQAEPNTAEGGSDDSIPF
jgi:hypothetical protein